MLEATYEITMPDLSALKSNAPKLAHRQASTDALDWWMSKRMKLRFDGSLSRQLGFDPRTEKWKIARRKRMRKFVADHNFTGDTAKRFAQAKYKISISRKGVYKFGLKVTGLGPQYERKTKFTRPGRPILIKELSRFTASEKKQMGKIYRDSFLDFLNNDPRARYKTNRRVKG